jgi:glc operon protein GlcG
VTLGVPSSHLPLPAESPQGRKRPRFLSPRRPPRLCSRRGNQTEGRAHPKGEIFRSADVHFIWKTRESAGSIRRMFKLLALMLSFLAATSSAADLTTRKHLNLATIKTMVAAAEAEAKRLNVEVTICIVDESGNLLFLEKADGASINTIQFAQKKARHSAFYQSPSKDGADALKKGNLDVLAFPDFFPNQGGLPIKIDGQTIGAIAASGAKSEIDEAIAQAGIDAVFKK